MSTVTLNGPVVRKGADNIVLYDVLLHSPVSRQASTANKHKIEVGIREGAATTWIGSWAQATQEVTAGVPVSILHADRLSMRLMAGQAIVARITADGVPASLKGARLNFRLGYVGGRYGEIRPLVSAGPIVADPNTRTALSAVTRQVQRLSWWEESLALVDPAELAPVGTFHGRLQVDSTSEVSLQRYNGNWIEVNGEALSIGDDGASSTAANKLLESTGAVGSSVPSAGNLYNVYVTSIGGIPEIRLSGTAPTRHLGNYYLGTDPGQDLWRFCGWVYYSDDSEFVDSETQRLCCNYHNRIKKDLFLSPGYVDDDAQDVLQEASVTWTAINSGADSQVEFLSNAEDAAVVHGVSTVYGHAAGVKVWLGIGIDSSTGADRAGCNEGTEYGNIALHYADVLSVGRHTADLLVRVNSSIGYYISNEERNGATEDPPVTYIAGQVLV